MVLWPPKSLASTSIFPPASGMRRKVTSLFSEWPFTFLSNERTDNRRAVKSSTRRKRRGLAASAAEFVVTWLKRVHELVVAHSGLLLERVRDKAANGCIPFRSVGWLASVAFVKRRQDPLQLRTH